MELELYLLVVGSRNFTDYELLKQTLDQYIQEHPGMDVHIVSGGASGADALAEKYARESGYQLHVFPADWSLGRSAGYVRNAQMHKFIAGFDNRCCFAFWDGTSKGTQHSFQLAKTYQNPLQIIRF